jgi:hypothetical protein
MKRAQPQDTPRYPFAPGTIDAGASPDYNHTPVWLSAREVAELVCLLLAVLAMAGLGGFLAGWLTA